MMIATDQQQTERRRNRDDGEHGGDDDEHKMMFRAKTTCSGGKKDTYRSTLLFRLDDIPLARTTWRQCDRSSLLEPSAVCGTIHKHV